MRTRLTILAVLVLSAVAAPVAVADDPPVITVPTPTAPAPDPRPVSKPKPKPKPRSQPRPSVHLPAARPARPVTRTYTPRPASVAPAKPRISRPPHKKRAVVKQQKPKPATKKPATTQPSIKQPEVVGAEQTHVTPPVASPAASPDTGFKADWSRTALLLVVVSILGTIVVLRRRRGRPRQVDVEVIEHQAERAVHFPLGKFNAPPVTQQALSALREEPVAPIAPAPAEQHSELGLHPRPAARTQ
jgi:hypothetical protein